MSEALIFNFGDHQRRQAMAAPAPSDDQLRIFLADRLRRQAIFADADTNPAIAAVLAMTVDNLADLAATGAEQLAAAASLEPEKPIGQLVELPTFSD